jgi:hypothetical protein
MLKGRGRPLGNIRVDGRILLKLVLIKNID